jgi:hypothetical protein
VDHWDVVAIVSVVVGVGHSVTGVPVTMGSSSVGGSMGSFGVLDFGGVDWDSIVDHWNVLGTVVQGIPARSG